MSWIKRNAEQIGVMLCLLLILSGILLGYVLTGNAQKPEPQDQLSLLVTTSKQLHCQSVVSRSVQAECMQMMDDLLALHDPAVDNIVHKHTQQMRELARQGLDCAGR